MREIKEAVPYTASSSTAGYPPFGPDAPIFEVMQSVRALRRLKSDPVPRDLLERIIEAATWAPSGANGQHWSFIIVTDREQIRRLAPLWRQINEFYFHSLLVHTRTSKQLDSVRYVCEHFEEIPAIIVACYDVSSLRLYRGWSGLIRRWRELIRCVRIFGPRRGWRVALSAKEGSALSAAASIYPAIENILLAARTLGLGATLTTGYLYLRPEVERILNIPKTVKTFAMIPIGYPIGKFGPVKRRPVSEVIYNDRWGTP